jgi:hypothetical protein
MNSASLFSLAGRCDNPIPPRFLAPRDFLKIPAQATLRGGMRSLESILGLLKGLKIRALLLRHVDGRMAVEPIKKTCKLGVGHFQYLASTFVPCTLLIE